MKNQSQPLRNMNKSILKQKNIDTNKEKKAANNSILTKAKNNEWKKNTGKPSYDVTWEWNKATGEIYVGDSIEEVFGYKVQNNTVSFMDFSSCLLPGEKDIVEEKLWKTLSSDSRSWKDSFMFKRLDGSIVATACRAKIVRDEEGNAIHLTGTIQDVSRLERLENNLKEQIILRTEQSEIFEAALRKSESNLQAIFENTSQGFILTDLNGIIKLFNNKSREIIRLNAERKIKIGDSLFDFIHPSRKGKYKHAITKVLGGETLRYDYPYTRKNGELKWFDFTVNPVYSGGAITGLIITSTDITERKQAEERLQRSESNLNAIIENTDAHIYSLDRNLRYITFNQRLKNTLKESFGMDIKIGDYILDFIIRFNPQDAEEWKTVYSKALKGEIVKFEKEFNVNDFYIYSSFSIHPIWERNEVVGLSCFVNDITKEKENVLHKEKITADLIQRNKDLEQFSYIVSHNLRAQVANIIGVSYTLQGNGLRDNLKKKVMSGLFTSVNKLDEVIKDLNNILKVRQGLNENKQIVNFTKLAHDIRLSIENIIVAEQASIICDFGQVNEMLIRKSYLHSIFYNLISNSLKYRQPNIPAIIEIKSEMVNNRVVLFFKDNGLGIDLQKWGNEVFGLYKRFHIDQTEGKGMGLFMVKTQVEAIGGKISISSEVNKGTEFKIEL